ncbi:ABC transporter ATP-binding protein [Brevibacillus thermoruber]|uniref:ABC transporter ATP-binding protein n=1 Tax=Brevibacillus thermoruber TaxID=33942 RepID=UPI003A5C0C80
MGGRAVAETVLSVKGLRKTIGGRPIIHDMTFDVYAGKVFGFLGPNGAGKTTTIRMLVGLASADGGEIDIGGISLRRSFPQAIAQVGCIVENPELYKFMTGRENLEHFARMSGGIPPERIEEIVRFVDLERAIDDKVKTYSLGMRQRLGIAQALLHRPKLLILDEPTNGLDPAGIRELRQFIRRLAEEEGLAVFVSSHLLSEIEMMCDRVAIINKGRVISVGPVQDLMEQFADRVAWTFPPEAERRGHDVLSGLPFVERVWPDGEGRLYCRMDTERIGEANAALVRAGVPVLGIAAKTVTLEDLFLALTGGGGEDGAEHARTGTK